MQFLVWVDKAFSAVKSKSILKFNNDYFIILIYDRMDLLVNEKCVVKAKTITSKEAMVLVWVIYILFKEV